MKSKRLDNKTKIMIFDSTSPEPKKHNSEKPQKFEQTVQNFTLQMLNEVYKNGSKQAII
jgi:hypothetical protein